MAQPAAERAYRHTKALILSGGVTGGTVLSEVAIAQELGVSRTPVHEAFLRLESEKLLALAPRQGAAVTPMSPDEARDVLEMREAIECSTARRCLGAGPLPAAVVQQMTDNVEGQRRCAKAGDLDGFLELEAGFHAILVDTSRNATAIFFYSLLRDRQQRLRRHLLQVGPEQVSAALEDHRLMAQVAASGDADQLCELIAAHVQRHRGLL